jgi:hypothetical protein
LWDILYLGRIISHLPSPLPFVIPDRSNNKNMHLSRQLGGAAGEGSMAKLLHHFPACQAEKRLNKDELRSPLELKGQDSQATPQVRSSAAYLGGDLIT